MLAKNPTHFVNGQNMFENYPDGAGRVLFGMGCFWGAERIFWGLNGVHVTSVGYAGGSHDNPDYRLVCTGRTGHAEVVHVVYDPPVITFEELLKVFFENHDPTQGNRQGNDIGTQYRSVIYTYTDEQRLAAKTACVRYESAYRKKGYGPITTEIKMAGNYYPAEDYHQQYLARNPNGYCGIGGTGVVCPIPARVEA
ncbi:MAG: peptide-methionine (S)-S-oxide reductase MsrA [Hyphomonadaceae bacterium]|nr:peptide-methionine (S)-S-oxide reductase MsrA [Hyphomonadaceae bacterium]MBC6412216.1 peptide-methionine (S)-S-oxide reductase MsrA [Hyphomonadaceae bacterium]